jgi:regulatory protein
MVRRDSSPTISRVDKIPRRKEYLVSLSDGTTITALEDHVVRFALAVGTRIGQDTLREIDECCEYARVRESALRLLKVRPRTEHELRRRLGVKQRSPRVLEKLIGDLKREGLVDDRLFADLWIQEKIARASSGRRLIIRDLERKGIERAVIDEQLKRNYDPAREAEIARGVAARKIARLAELPEKVRRQRAFEHLLRRGFEADIASAAVLYALSSPGEETAE